MNLFFFNKTGFERKYLEFSIRLLSPFMENETSDIIKFYGLERPYSFLSNFYPCSFKVDDILYTTTEHYYQSMKFTKLRFIQRQIIECKTPGEAFLLAKAFSSKIDKDWNSRKESVMIKALNHKFDIPHIAQQLITTGETELVKDNTKDSFWGCGYDGYGLNRMGTLLMRKRQQLKDQKIQDP